MLAQMLWGLTNKAPESLPFVGLSSGLSAANTTHTFTLDGLTGGVSSSPQAGDLVVACLAIPAASSITCTSAGYTTAVSGASSSSTTVGLAVFYKRLTEPENSISFSLGSSKAASFAAQVWRGTNASPVDGAASTLFASGGPDIVDLRREVPALTTSVSNTVVIAFGAAAGSGTRVLSNPIAPVGFSRLATGFNSVGATLAMSSAPFSGVGAYDPGPYGGFIYSGGVPWAAVSIALRP